MTHGLWPMAHGPAPQGRALVLVTGPGAQLAPSWPCEPGAMSREPDNAINWPNNAIDKPKSVRN